MHDQPLISVVMPAYNAAAFVGDAIVSALAQTYSALEVLVVDDGSTDATAAVVGELARRDGRVRLLRQANAGVAAARNLAIRESRGELIAPLDADDLWFPRKLERQVDRLREAGPATGLVYCWCARIDRHGRPLRPSPGWRVEGRAHDRLLYVNFLENASVPLMRRSCVEEAGGYNAERRRQGGQGCEDWELALRIAERHELAVAPEYLVAYRVTHGSMSTDCSAMARGHELLLSDAAERCPRTPPRLPRWSRSHFALYLAEVACAGGNGAAARRWLAEAVRSDPWAAASPWAFKTLARSLAPARGAAAASGNASGPAGRVLDVASADIPETPPLWKPWVPYDRLCLSRWRRLDR